MRTIKKILTHILVLLMLISVSPLGDSADSNPNKLFELNNESNASNTVGYGDPITYGDVTYEQGIKGKAVRIRNTSAANAQQYISFPET